MSLGRQFLPNMDLKINSWLVWLIIFFLQKVKEGTRGVAILDLILTNRDDLVEGVAVRGTLRGSDRVLLQFWISEETKAECTHTYTLHFRKPNFKKLRTLLGKVQWQKS